MILGFRVHPSAPSYSRCPTEITAFSDAAPEFAKLNAQACAGPINHSPWSLRTRPPIAVRGPVIFRSFASGQLPSQTFSPSSDRTFSSGEGSLPFPPF